MQCIIYKPLTTSNIDENLESLMINPLKFHTEVLGRREGGFHGFQKPPFSDGRYIDTTYIDIIQILLVSKVSIFLEFI